VNDHEQIRRLLADYCHACDDGDFDLFADLFTEGATFTVMGDTHRGRAAIRAFMEAAQPPERRGKHIISEPAIALDGDGASAHCRTDYAFVGRGSDARSLAVTSTGRYVDRLERGPDRRWRLADRRIVFLGDPE
jgi:uncharacterized protein (TIGR02246 family)